MRSMNMQVSPRRAVAVAVATAIGFSPVVFVHAAEAPVSATTALAAANPAAQAQAQLDKALTFLKAHQKPDGGWQTDKNFPAFTAIVLQGFVQSGKYSSKDDFVKKGFEKLFSYQLDSGGIYQDALANYNTAIAVSAIASANDPAYKDHLDHAVAFLKKLQWVPNGEKGPKGEQVADDKQPWYGGFGYGNHARPDLSNTHFAIEALKEAGLKEDDPAFQAALKFVSRTQNNSETNDLKFAGDDGGFVYSVGTSGEGDSEAENYTTPDGKKLWRSYGSMTYAGLKSMIYAGVKRDDPRVKAAIDWITKNWSLDENPGMRLYKPEQARHGLYYYYNVFAKALNAYDQPVVTDSKGDKHDWRQELIAKLGAQQRPDGSWVGDKRWMESDPVLSTAYAVLALEEALKDLKEHPVK